MMDALGVARDLGADYALGVGVVRRATDATDGAIVEHLDLERAGRGAVMRTRGMTDPDGLQRLADGLIHGVRGAYPSGRPLSSEPRSYDRCKPLERPDNRLDLLFLDVPFLAAHP